MDVVTQGSSTPACLALPSSEKVAKVAAGSRVWMEGELSHWEEGEDTGTFQEELKALVS